MINWFASHPAELIAGIILTNRFANITGAAGERWPLDAAELGSENPNPHRWLTKLIAE